MATIPQTQRIDVTVVGGGIVGLATALAVSRRFPDARIVLLEKEKQVAAHQTGHNSGVIHSGIYYTPGSLKAQLARHGNQSMQRFCQTHAIPFEQCGKLIVASTEAERPALEALYQRGLENGLAVSKLSREQVSEREPHVECIEGLWVPSTGIVDYRQVSRVLQRILEERGVMLCFNRPVTGLSNEPFGIRIETPQGPEFTRFLINCGGLQSDRLAQMHHVKAQARIVPFRGEYYHLKPERSSLVKGLIYPVPNPNFPFLGVHLTRSIDGSVHAGPNAILSLKREGYQPGAFDIRDAWESLSYPGLWRLVQRYAKVGVDEVLRSWSRERFLKSVQRLVPELTGDDLVPGECGIRAQALTSEGRLVDDFLIIEAPHALHVCNAPSPAATASLEIGKTIAARIPKPDHLKENDVSEEDNM